MVNIINSTKLISKAFDKKLRLGNKKNNLLYNQSEYKEHTNNQKQKKNIEK